MKFSSPLIAALYHSARFATREFRGLHWDALKRKGRKTVTVRTRQGLYTVYCSDDAIGKRLYCDHGFERELMKQVVLYLRDKQMLQSPGTGTFVDVGANIGVSSISMLLANQFRRAIAIEPDPDNFVLLERNVRQNDLNDRVTCLPYAASNSEGRVTFSQSQDNFGDHRVQFHNSEPPGLFGESDRKTISVESRCLDSFFSQFAREVVDDIALIWIDTQGHEGYVFQGAQELLKRDLPVISEICPYMIQRSGMTADEFCAAVEGRWSHFALLRWTRRESYRFLEFSTEYFRLFFDALGYEGDYEEVIFLRNRSVG